MAVTTPSIVVIGGGTGSFTLLQALKQFTPHLTAIVNMSDDGGGTGKLRDELGVLPPGDIRQCLVALSNLPDVRDLFNYRFGDGSLAGQSLGNVILSGLELQYAGDFERAINIASRLLNITGQVLPVTLQKHRLVMQDGDQVIRGESSIGQHQIKHKNASIRLSPKVKLNPRAAEAIAAADLIVIAPGNLFCSLLPPLSVDGMKRALAASSAKKVVISNLVNKPGQTDNWHVVDFVQRIENYIGPGQVDVLLYNNAPPTPELLAKYAADGEFPVKTEARRFKEIKARVIGTNLLSPDIVVPHANDTLLKRTLIRHDATQVGRQLMRLFYE